MHGAHLIVSVVFFLAFVIVTMWGSEISAGTRGGLEHGRAQAAAERRRAASAMRTARRRAREVRATGARGVAGTRRAARAAGAGIGSVRAGMRGPRPGSAPGSAVPARSGPGRRILAAAGRGAVAGARQAGRVGRAAARGVPGIRGGLGMPARLRNRARGTRHVPARELLPRPAARERTARTRPAGRVGSCDSCGKITPALQPSPVLGPDGVEELWLLCYTCREILAPRRPEPGSAAPVPAAPAVPASGTAVSPPETPELTGRAARPAEDPEPAEPAVEQHERIPELVPAGATPALASPGGASPMAVPGQINARPRVGITAGTSAAPATRGGADVAVKDSTTHGGYARNVEAVARALAYMRLMLDAMTGDLKSVNASADQIRDINAWSAEVTAAMLFIVTGFGGLDKKIRRLIEAYLQIGGVDQGADPRFYRDI